MSRIYICYDENNHGHISLDGKDITNIVNRFTISDDAMSPGPPSLTIEYACVEQMTIEGGFDVHHVCPKKAR